MHQFAIVKIKAKNSFEINFGQQAKNRRFFTNDSNLLFAPFSFIFQLGNETYE